MPAILSEVITLLATWSIRDDSPAACSLMSYRLSSTTSATRKVMPSLLDRSSVLPNSEDTCDASIVPAWMFVPLIVSAAISSPVIVPAAISFAVIDFAAICSAVTDFATRTVPESRSWYSSCESCSVVSPVSVALIA